MTSLLTLKWRETGVLVCCPATFCILLKNDLFFVGWGEEAGCIENKSFVLARIPWSPDPAAPLPPSHSAKKERKEKKKIVCDSTAVIPISSKKNSQETWFVNRASDEHKTLIWLEISPAPGRTFFAQSVRIFIVFDLCLLFCAFDKNAWLERTSEIEKLPMVCHTGYSLTV